MPLLTRHDGAAIRSLRIQSGMKPGEFAASVRISYQHLDNIENGRKEASIEVLHRIATALDVPIAEIVRDTSTLSEAAS